MIASILSICYFIFMFVYSIASMIMKFDMPLYGHIILCVVIVCIFTVDIIAFKKNKNKKSDVQPRYKK